MCCKILSQSSGEGWQKIKDLAFQQQLKIHFQFLCLRLVRYIPGISSSLVFPEWAVAHGECVLDQVYPGELQPPWRAVLGGLRSGEGPRLGQGKTVRREGAAEWSCQEGTTAPLPHYECNGAKFSWQRWFNTFAKCNFTWAVSHPRHLFDSIVKLPEVSDKCIKIPSEYKLLQMIDRELVKLSVMTSSNLVILSLHRKWWKPLNSLSR